MTHLNDELLDAAADGAALDAAATEHLRACAECHAQVERVRVLRAQLAALPRVAASDVDVWPQVRDAIRARRARRRVRFAGIALPLAAAVLFAVVRVAQSPDATSDAARGVATSELAELRGLVQPLVVEAMAANLIVYDAALQELEAYAALERENMDIRSRIDDLRRKRAALLRLASNS